MNHTLYMRMLLLMALALTASACGQKGPLVAAPDAPPAAQENPAPEITTATTEEADD